MSTVSPRDRLPGEKNYYIGRDEKRWATGVPLYSRIEAEDVYAGIDIAFRGNKSDLEFDFVVKPGADPKEIRLVFEGARNVQIDPSGDLILSSTAGNLELHRPVAYQRTSNGKQTLVSTRFVHGQNGEVRLALESYDRDRQLVIDPSVTYATYLGGIAQDEGLGVAIDNSGNTFVTGATGSANFPNTGGGLPYSGGLDAFITGFDSHDHLIFSTLIGGSGDDVGTSIAVSDTGGNPGVFVTGYTTSTDFPASTNQYFLAGIQNAFVLTLNYPEGYYQAATYLGGEAVDTGLAITFDTVIGYVYVAGQTTSQHFPINSPLFNESHLNMGAGPGPSDGFVAELYPDLSGFYFSTFLGGANEDFASGIALDRPDSTFHNIYITGGSRSGGSSSPPSFYTTPGAFQTTCGTDGNCNGGQDDAFITVICVYQASPCNAIGLAPNYVYSTFLGGSGSDDAYSISADTSGNSYLTGQTSSMDFKLMNPYQRALRGPQNAFVAKMNPSGSGLVFSTYLGGSGMDAGLGLTIDNSANVYVTGRTNSPDFPVQFATQTMIGGGYDAFISVLNPAGSALTFSTFLGGSNDEDILGGSIAVDQLQNVSVTGDTNSSDFPTVSPYQGTIGSTQNCTINGNQALCPDAFVARLNAQSSNASILTVTIPLGPLGIVNSDPPGINQCSNGSEPGICTAEFPNGTLITLTATPVEDLFGGWGGDAPPSCGMNLTCQFEITSNLNVTATFVPVVGQLYTLFVSGTGVMGTMPGTGTITSSPAGIDCGTGGQICQFNFAQGTMVTLTAASDPDSYFYGWSTDPPNPACSGTGNCVVVMNSNQTVNYTFLSKSSQPPSPDFTLTVTPASLGDVTVGGQGVAAVAISTQNGFTDTINLSCSVAPAMASSPSCTVTPSSLSIPVNGAGSATLIVNTTGIVAAARRDATSPALGLFIPFLGVLLTAGTRSRSWRHWLTTLLLAVVSAVISSALACGSGGSRATGGVAQPGNYTVIVKGQGTSTFITHSIDVPVTVQ